MLPRAQTACSRTSSLGLIRSCTKIGTAPLAITMRVCSLVPDAMLVSAHAASNWSIGLSADCRNWTKRGTTPAEMTSAIGGERSIESSLRKTVTAWSCAAGSCELTASTSCAGLASSHACEPTACRGQAGSTPPPAAPDAPVWSAPAGTIAAAPAPNLFFCSCSARLSFRSEIVVSSRLRRASSLSSVFLN